MPTQSSLFRNGPPRHKLPLGVLRIRQMNRLAGPHVVQHRARLPLPVIAVRLRGPRGLDLKRLRVKRPHCP